jgi:hypothetical protein
VFQLYANSTCNHATNTTMRWELNLLTATGGRGGHKMDCGSKWCFGELNLDGNDAVCTVTPLNAENNSSNDSTSGSDVSCDSDTRSKDTDDFLDYIDDASHEDNRIVDYP